MGQKTARVAEVYALLDEATLRRTLAQIEQLRLSPGVAGLDLCYGAVVTLEIVPEQLACNRTAIQVCRVRAGGWSSELPPRTQMQKGLPA